MAKQAWFKRVLTLTRKPTAVTNRTRFVDINGNQLTAANTRASGISQDGVDATEVTEGKQITVTVLGIEELEVGAATAPGALLTSDASGRGVTATTGQVVNAIGLEGGSAAGDRVPALIVVGPVVAP